MSSPYTFTRDWFTWNIKNWEHWLAEYKGKDASILEIGSFQGRSAVWLLENILTHPQSSLYCCDTFEGSIEHSPEETRDMFEIFQSNISAFKDKVHVLKGKSEDCLKADNFSVEKTEFFDAIYIDGDHRSSGVLADAVLCHPLLKKGGLLIFDDYRWGNTSSIQVCKIGIDCFVKCYRPYYDIVANDYQLCLKKRHEPLIPPTPS
jgi:predicted O-methyltransferase YrrM